MQTPKWTIGSDEAGYGTWAGSLVVAATALPQDWEDSKVKDSKKLSHAARVAAVQRWRPHVAWAVQEVTAEYIDQKGVWDCVIWAHSVVHNKLREQLLEKGIPASEIQHIADGLENGHDRLAALCKGPITTMAKADTKIPAVSLASCFAKTSQCLLMDRLHKRHPEYGFDSHRGYGTADHSKALQKLGPLKGVHRFSYSSIKRLGSGGVSTLLDEHPEP